MTLLADKPICGRNEAMELLQAQTNNNIDGHVFKKILSMTKDQIEVEKGGPNNKTIYSLKLKLKGE